MFSLDFYAFSDGLQSHGWRRRSAPGFFGVRSGVGFLAHGTLWRRSADPFDRKWAESLLPKLSEPFCQQVQLDKAFTKHLKVPDLQRSGNQQDHQWPADVREMPQTVRLNRIASQAHKLWALFVGWIRKLRYYGLSFFYFTSDMILQWISVCPEEQASVWKVLVKSWNRSCTVPNTSQSAPEGKEGEEPSHRSGH